MERSGDPHDLSIEWGPALDHRDAVADVLDPEEMANGRLARRGSGGPDPRHFRSYDPDTSSREYRETLSPIDEDTRRNYIEVRDDERRWREWGVFTHVREGPRERSQECEGLTGGG